MLRDGTAITLKVRGTPESYQSSTKAQEKDEDNLQGTKGPAAFLSGLCCTGGRHRIGETDAAGYYVKELSSPGKRSARRDAGRFFGRMYGDLEIL